MNREAAAQAIEDFLRALGHDPKAEGDLIGTGRRVADAWIDELLEGERLDPIALLREESFPRDNTQPGSLVVLREVAVWTMCPHHLLPASGVAQLAYLPGDRLTGLGTLAKALDALARRLTLQERIGEELVSAMMTGLGARGAACHLSLRHGCLSARGSRTNAVVETLATAGLLAPDGSHASLLSKLGIER